VLRSIITVTVTAGSHATGWTQESIKGSRH
jgi:hypothetical protein